MVFTRPAPARQDALFRGRGRSVERGLRAITHYVSCVTSSESGARTKLGQRRIPMRRGWVGEKGDFFNILLGMES
jgi:hypothetical protein